MQDIRSNALKNAWPEASTWEALTIKARKNHVGSGPCGTGVGHCHGEAAALVACSSPGVADRKVHSSAVDLVGLNPLVGISFM